MEMLMSALKAKPRLKSTVLNALHNKYYSTHVPPTTVHWFYATDVPNSKPKEFNYTQEKKPTKFLPFAKIDSDNLESVYQKWKMDHSVPPLVAVSEDRLFDCDLTKMEMAPAFWDGPIYEIRRGLWFQDKVPLPSAISDQLEEGYLKLKPYYKKWEKLKVESEESMSDTDPETDSDSGSESLSGSSRSRSGSDLVTPGSNLKLKADIEKANRQKEERPGAQFQDIVASDQNQDDLPEYLANSKSEGKLLIHEIISEVNLYEKQNRKKWPFEKVADEDKEDKLVIYKDSNTAFLAPKSSMMTKLQIEYLPEMPIFSYLGGSKIKRGYFKSPSIEKQNASVSRPRKKTEAVVDNTIKDGQDPTNEEGFLSSIVKTFTFEESDKKLQSDLEDDYSNEPSLEQNSGDREVDHLIIAVHGIGQSLSSKFSGMNFIHDCNSTRKSIKRLVKDEPKFNDIVHPYKAKGEKDGSTVKSYANSKIQILPVVWRYKVDFSLNKQWDDLDSDGSFRLPTLEEINVDAVTPIRNLAADVILDILLYYDPIYKEKILKTVVKMANDIYDKYTERHPDFKGKVSLMGHSLGSSIVLDILSEQPDDVPKDKFDPEKHLKFNVENFFGCGSPNGVFKFIRKQNIRSRAAAPVGIDDEGVLSREVQSPKVKNYYNIFYATDPVAYRIEPMVHSKLSRYAPMKISYASKNLNAQLQSFQEQLTMQTTNKLISSITGVKEMKDSDEESPVHEEAIPEKAFELMHQLNQTGRIDYSLPVSIFDIGVSAIASHTQYFDDPDVAGFMIKQLFAKNKDIKKSMGILRERYIKSDVENK